MKDNIKTRKEKLYIYLILFLIINVLITFGIKKILNSYALPNDWYKNYTYTLNDDNNSITLKKYNGTENEIKVFSTITLDNKSYNVIIDGDVYNGNKEIKSVIFENGVSGGSSLSKLFYECTNLESVNFNNFNTVNTITMEMMFQNCNSLTSLDLGNFNTSNVTNMRNMFHSCSLLNHLNVKSFNTSNVTDMSGMFYGLSKLNKLDISSFNTSNVTNMFDTFNGLSTLNEIKLGTKTNLKVNSLPSAGNFSRGTWKRTSDGKEFSAVEIGINSTKATGAAGTYQKISSISSELKIDFPVTYKIEKISKIDEYNFSTDSNFFIESDESIYTTIPLSKTSIYNIPGSVDLLFKNVVSDNKGNKYNLKLKISNIVLYDLDVKNNVEQVKMQIVSISGNTIIFSHNFVNPANNLNVFINENGVSRKQDVEIQIVDNDGNVQNGNYIFSAYDIDLASAQDSGYGIYSEGINFISGFDTNNIILSANSFLDFSTISGTNNKRITGTRSDNESEASEFLILADANNAKFQWTAGKTCVSKFFTYYQPQIVEIIKKDISGKNVSNIVLQLYKDNVLYDSWTTNNESKKIFLTPGKYVLKEIEMPSYYNKADDIEFFVDINDTLTIGGNNVANITMINYYKNSAGVIEKHIDEYSGEILYQNNHTGKVNDEYKTTSKEFDNYTLVKTPSNANGLMEEQLIEVIYYYRKNYNVITKVNGTGGTIVGDEVVLEGNDSTPDKIVITPNENYIIEKITINSEDIPIIDKNGMILPNFEEMLEDKLIVVNFVQEIQNVPNTDKKFYILPLVLFITGMGVCFIKIRNHI